jgi:hypothetical protein
MMTSIQVEQSTRDSLNGLAKSHGGVKQYAMAAALIRGWKLLTREQQDEALRGGVAVQPDNVSEAGDVNEQATGLIKDGADILSILQRALRDRVVSEEEFGAAMSAIRKADSRIDAIAGAVRDLRRVG